MNLLIDTHVFIWMMTDESRLSATAKDALANPDNTRLVSAVVAWELAIKTSIKKLSLEDPLEYFLSEGLRKAKAIELPVRINHATATGVLPPHHTDPFDRLLIAQAQVESCFLVTADRKMSAYDVSIIW